MDTVRSFQGLDVGPIQKYLATCETPFDVSPLYSTETEQSFVDDDLRRSVYRTITSSELFDLVEDLMATINEGDDEYQYVLWKNGSDITHIKYEEGGFFKRHRDFNSTTSNLIEEFSLLVCVTPEEEVAKGVEGGQTSIATFGGVDAEPVEKLYDTTTPGSALLFRKDLNHEGKRLVKGAKHIITANLFAVKKIQTEQVLYVTFPEEGNKEVADGKKDEKESMASKAIQWAANELKSYVVPVSMLTGMLEAHVRWANDKADSGGKDPPRVVPFVCRDYSFEEFGVIAKILTRSYVDVDSISKYQECLNYFGPFKVENLLVDLAVEDAVKDTTDVSNEGKEPAQKKQKDDSKDEEVKKVLADDKFDPTVIVCENEARMKAVLDTARAFNEPYVPFKILFIEGMLHNFDGDGWGLRDVIDVPMTAAACFVGDYNNVFGLWCLDQYNQPNEDFTLEAAHKCCPFFHCAPESHSEQILGLDIGSKVNLFDFGEDKDPYGEYEAFEMNVETVDGERKTVKMNSEEFLRDGLGLGLNVRVSDEELKSGLLKYLFNKYDRANVTPLDLRAGLSKGDEGSTSSSKFFHLDSDGKACFTRKQAELASDYIASMKLEEKVKASLQKKKFELPQVSEKVSIVYCNDDRYGRMNVLWVCGVLRLEEDGTSKRKMADTDTTEEEFDAWPSDVAKEKIRHAKRLHSKYGEIFSFGGDPGYGWWEYDTDESSVLRFDGSEDEALFESEESISGEEDGE